MSTHRWRGTAARMLAVVVLVGLGLLIWRRWLTPRFPDTRLGNLQYEVPRFLDAEGLTAPVYHYGEHAAGDLLVVGDSRVQAMLVADEFEAAGLGPTSFVTGPAAQLQDLVAAATRLEPGRMVLCLSPLSVYWTPPPHLAALLDEERGPWTRARIEARLEAVLEEAVREIGEPIYPQYWRGGWFGALEPRRSNGIYKNILRADTRAPRRAALKELGDRVRELQQLGWSVTCVRLPTEPSLRELEDQRFPNRLFVMWCEALGVPYLDGWGRTLAYSDGSHVVPAQARWMSRMVAGALSRLARGEGAADPPR